MVNEYNNGDTLCIVPVGGTRPTHGDYPVGALLYDNNLAPTKGWYICTSTTFPLSWSKLPSPLNVLKNVAMDGKYGSYMTNSMVVKGTGLMQDIAGVGNSFTPNAIDGSGTSHAFASGTATIQNTGVVILRPVGAFAGLTRLAFLPCYNIRNTPSARTGGDTRYYSGFITNTSGMTIGEDPIVQADGGLVVGYNSTDINFNIWHGDGTNPITKVEINSPAVVPAPVTTTNFSIEMITISSAQVIINIYAGNTNILLGTRTITTNLPVSTKTLNWASVIQNPTNINKNLTVYGANMETLK